MFLAPTIAGVGAAAVVHSEPPQLDSLMLTGFLSAFVALACWPYAKRSRPARILCAAAIGTLAFYCFAAGAWPAGMVALVAAGATVWSWAENVRTSLTGWWRDGTKRRMPSVKPKGGRISQLYDDGLARSGPPWARGDGREESARSRQGWAEGNNN